MRVLLASSSSGSQGGGELYLKFLAEGLVREGVEVGFWLSGDRQMDRLARLLGGIGPVLRSSYTNTFKRRGRSLAHLLPNTSEIAAALEKWKEFQPDILHLNKQCLEDGLDLLGVAGGVGVPSVCTVHITQTAKELKAAMSPVRDWMAKRELDRYKGGYIAISEQRAEGLRNFLGPEPSIHCIPNGVEIPSDADWQSQRMAKRGELGIGPDALLVVAVGRFNPQKDPLKFLDWFAELAKREPKLRGIWVGDGELRASFEERATELGLGDRIQLPGWVDSASAWLAAADVYFHPAAFEGLPFALLEAMARRLPCVLSASLATELKEMPKASWILPESNGDWVDCLLSEEHRANFADKAFQMARARYSIEAMARATKEVYIQAVEDRA